MSRDIVGSYKKMSQRAPRFQGLTSSAGAATGAAMQTDIHRSPVNSINHDLYSFSLVKSVIDLFVRMRFTLKVLHPTFPEKISSN